MNRSLPREKDNLDNLTNGPKPALHAAAPNWDTLQGLVERAAESLDDAKKKTNGLPTRFAAAYGAAFWLSRVALEACGYRLAGAEGHRVTVFQSPANTLEWETTRWRRLDDLHRLRNRFDYGDIIDVSEQQVETAIKGAEDLLQDILKTFPAAKP